MIPGRISLLMLFLSFISLHVIGLIEANKDITPSSAGTGANFKPLNSSEKHSDYSHTHTRRGRCFFSSSSSYDQPPVAGDDMYWNFNPRTGGAERNLGRIPSPPQALRQFVQ